MIFSDFLIDWYDKNGRVLPWRTTRSPYSIWVSEIILQQTRVEQGINYYYKFLEIFPTITDLANAEIDTVLKVWQGLGYYSRARNMHATAVEIAEKHNGRFPSTRAELQKLKGIGKYTSAAIASFAFGAPVAAVDGNAIRVISRFLGIDVPVDSAKGLALIEEAASELIDKQHPGLYNQAMMDLGATICTPQEPKCSFCPVSSGCLAFSQGKTVELPVKSKKTSKRDRFFNYIVPVENGYTYICKRGANDIWNSYSEFPLIETDSEKDISQIVASKAWREMFGLSHCDIMKVVRMPKHVLSHQNIFSQFVVVSIDSSVSFFDDQYIKVNFAGIEKYSVSRLIDKFLAKDVFE